MARIQSKAAIRGLSEYNLPRPFAVSLVPLSSKKVTIADSQKSRCVSESAVPASSSRAFQSLITWVHEHIHTCTHTHIHTYIHTYTHTHMCFKRPTSFNEFTNSLNEISNSGDRDLLSRTIKSQTPANEFCFLSQSNHELQRPRFVISPNQIVNSGKRDLQDLGPMCDTVQDLRKLRRTRFAFSHNQITNSGDRDL
jgi:hypothetical protein